MTVDEKGAQLSHEALLTAWPRLRAGWTRTAPGWRNTAVRRGRPGLGPHRPAGRRPVPRGPAGRGHPVAGVGRWTGSGCTRSSGSSWTARTRPSRRARLAVRRRTRRLRALVAALSVLLLVAERRGGRGERAAGARGAGRAVEPGPPARGRVPDDDQRRPAPGGAARPRLVAGRADVGVPQRVLVAAGAQYRGSAQAGADGSVSAIAAAPTAGSPPPAAGTARCGCGTSRAAGRSAGSARSRAGTGRSR